MIIGISEQYLHPHQHPAALRPESNRGTDFNKTSTVKGKHQDKTHADYSVEKQTLQVHKTLISTSTQVLKCQIKLQFCSYSSGGFCVNYSKQCIHLIICSACF